MSATYIYINIYSRSLNLCALYSLFKMYFLVCGYLYICKIGFVRSANTRTLEIIILLSIVTSQSVSQTDRARSIFRI